MSHWRHQQQSKSSAVSSSSSRYERIAQEGVFDYDAMFWLAIFPLLAAGVAVALNSDLQEALMGSHHQHHQDMKTRPLRVPGTTSSSTTATTTTTNNNNDDDG